MSLLSRLILALVLFETAVFAQSEIAFATLNGTVLDATGAAVPNAKLTLTNTNTGLQRTVESTEAGLFNFSRIPAGAYDLNVEAQGFKQSRRSGIGLNVGSVLTLDLSLEVGGTTETVTVTTETPVIETTRSQTSTVINEKAVRDLPINNRNFLDFAALTPGVVFDPRGGDLSFGGQRGPMNSLLIDGADSNNLFFGQSTGRAGVRNPYSFSQESVQEFQVNANGYLPEVGRAGGGVINVITKSGTNDIHGNAFWFWRTTKLNANRASNKWSPNAANPQGLPRQRYEFDQFGANAGGPAIRDRLFWFFNYEGQRNQDPVTLTLPGVPGDPATQQAVSELAQYIAPYQRTQNNDIMLLKLDWNISPNQSLNGRYNYHRFKGQNYENTFQTAENGTGNSNIYTDNVTLNYNRVIGSTKIWDARFNFVRDDEPGTANAPGPRTVENQGGQQYIEFGQNNFCPRYTNLTSYQGISTLGWTAGSHTFKFGGDLNVSKIENYFPGQFGGTYNFNSLADYAARRPSSYIQAFGGPNTEGPLSRPDVSEYAFFAQDSWRASQRLTLNYGVRYDLFDYRAGDFRNDNPGLLALGIETDRINLDKNNVSLRFGFAYKLTDRVVMRGGVGNYYGRTSAIVTGTAHTNNGFTVLQYFFTPATPGFPTYPNILANPTFSFAPNVYALPNDYEQPETYQWSYSIEFQPLRDVAVNVGYLGVRGLRLPRTRDLNLPTPEALQGTVISGSERTPITFFRYTAARPNSAFGRVQINESAARSIYHAGFVQITKRYAQNFQLQASYTWSKVIDTVPTPVAVVPETGDDAALPQFTIFPDVDRAVGDSDVPHRLVASGVWDINYAQSLQNRFWRGLLHGYQLSMIGSANSGRPYSLRVNLDLNGDGNTRNDRPPYVGRNTERLPMFATLDLRASKDIGLFTERARLRLMFEAFNVTNRTNITGRNAGLYNVNLAAREFTRPTNFGFANASGDPRILQLAAKVIW
ncbi:MAG TPA: TonB-dependent receptor [Bryobacteraceae bacterium]|nr:TonB-dependent receptor [Bryobacteraceae bacterium]